MGGRSNSPDAPCIHDQRTVNSDEAGGIEAFHDFCHGEFHEVAVGPYTQFHVVFGGLQPIDILGVHENRAAGSSHRDSVQIRRRIYNAFKRRKSVGVGSLRTMVNPRFCALQSLVEALWRKWL